MIVRRDKDKRSRFFLCHRTNPGHLVKLIDGIKATMPPPPVDNCPGRFFTDPRHHNIFYPGTLVQIDMVAKWLPQRLAVLITTPHESSQMHTLYRHAETGKQGEKQ